VIYVTRLHIFLKYVAKTLVFFWNWSRI